MTKQFSKAWIVLFSSVFIAANAEPIDPNTRIISAGGSITEIMYALNLDPYLVAVDTSSSYPPQVAGLPKVGYFRSLGAEGLMSLNPDMLIAAKGAGPAAILDQLKQLGVEIKTYEQSTYTLDSWKSLVSAIGQDFDRAELAQELVAKVVGEIKLQQDAQQGQMLKSKNINAVALLSIGQRGPVAAGKNTVPNLLLELAGVNNVAKTLEGYKPLSSELLAEQELDFVLVPSHVVDGLGGENAICNNQVIKMATSSKCNLHIMDGLLLMGFGARLDKAVGDVISFANRSEG